MAYTLLICRVSSECDKFGLRNPPAQSWLPDLITHHFWNREAGGVKKVITKTAENVYDHLSSSEQTIARNIFLRLTELGEGVQDTRRRMQMAGLVQATEQEAVAKVLQTLTDVRLVTTEQDSAEMAHEALIREWETLRKWLDDDRESLRLHRHLKPSTTHGENPV